MNYRTLADMAQLIRANLHRIPRLPVVGIPRSGMIAASMIATMKNLPLWPVVPQGEPFLLVDDTVSGGETFKKWMPKFPKTRPTTLAVYRKPNSPPVDICFETLPGPRVFEWNWAKHVYTKKAVFDIDGVICDEEARIANWDDIDHVQKVREAARPLHLPAREVLAIATGRKENEREFTEAWLAKHGVRYKRIFFSTKERGAKRTKLLAAQETGATWIIESDPVQAVFLRDWAQVPVLCTDLNQMLSPRTSQD